MKYFCVGLAKPLDSIYLTKFFNHMPQSLGESYSVLPIVFKVTSKGQYKELMYNSAVTDGAKKPKPFFWVLFGP